MSLVTWDLYIQVVEIRGEIFANERCMWNFWKRNTHRIWIIGLWIIYGLSMDYHGLSWIIMDDWDYWVIITFGFTLHHSQICSPWCWNGFTYMTLGHIFWGTMLANLPAPYGSHLGKLVIFGPKSRAPMFLDPKSLIAQLVVTLLE